VDSCAPPQSTDDVNQAAVGEIGPWWGWLESFSSPVRGSFLTDNASDRDGTDFRVIVCYDIPVVRAILS